MKRNDLDLRNRLKAEFFNRDPVTGELVKYDEIISPNGITDEGIEHLLPVVFDGGTQIGSWYLGLINNSSFSALAAADTMSSHAGWIEYTGYSEGTRPEWEPDAPVSRAIENGTTVDYTMNGGAQTIRGAFLVSDSTKSGTTGTLWMTTEFGAPKAVTSSTVLRLTYTIDG